MRNKSKRAKRKEIETLQRLIVEQLPQLIYVVDTRSHEIIYSNQSRAPARIEDLMCTLYGKDDEPLRWEEAIGATRPVRYTAQVTARAGVPVEYECLIRPLQGRQHAVMLVASDVTERTITEEERLQEEVRERVSAFASGTIHDLRTRLQEQTTSHSIAVDTINKLRDVLYDTVLEGYTGDDSVKEHVDRLLTSVTEEMQRLRQGIRRIEEVPNHLNLLVGAKLRGKERVCLRELVQSQAYHTQRTLNAQRDGYDIHVEVKGSQPDIDVEVDRSALEQVINNLLTNAAEAQSGRGRIEAKWSYYYPQDREYALAYVTVSDIGPGIDKDKLHEIFRPGYSTTGEKERGFGLSQVHGIMAAHGGTFQVLKTGPQGTHMRISLRAPRNGANGSEEYESSGYCQ